jgi:hypothetical protein
MSTALMMQRIAEVSPRLKARIAGMFYLLTIFGGSLALFLHGRLYSVADLIAGASYAAVTLLLYDMFKPVNRNLSLLAAVFSIVGSIVGHLGLPRQGLDIEMMSFGCYSLLMGYLIFRSTLLPRILSGLMACAGLAWLTFLSPRLGNRLDPYNRAAGGIAQLSLCMWLLVMGVNAEQRKERAGAANGDHSAPIALDSIAR